MQAIDAVKTGEMMGGDGPVPRMFSIEDPDGNHICIVANARTRATVCTMGWVIPGGTLTTTGTTPADPPFTLPIAGAPVATPPRAGTALIEKTKTTFRLLP